MFHFRSLSRHMRNGEGRGLLKMQETLTDNATESRRGYALSVVLLGSVIISFAGVLVRMIETADAWQINFYRAIAQMGFVLFILLVQHRSAIFTKIIAIGFPGVFGGLALAGASITYMESITSTTVANTLFLLSGIPLATALLARVFLGEKMQRSTLIAMGVAAMGILIMLGEGISGGSLYGNVMGIITVFGFSTFAVIVRKYRDLDMMPALLVTTSTLIVVTYFVKGGDMAVSDNDILICAVWGVPDRACQLDLHYRLTPLAGSRGHLLHAAGIRCRPHLGLADHRRNGDGLDAGRRLAGDRSRGGPSRHADPAGQTRPTPPGTVGNTLNAGAGRS